VRCGQSHQKLGQSKREFIQAAANDYLQPLPSFLDGDMKTIQVCVQIIGRQFVEKFVK